MIAVAIPASSLCLNRRLYYIATANTVTNSKRQRLQAVMVDLAIALGIPLLYGAIRTSTFFFVVVVHLTIVL